MDLAKNRYSVRKFSDRQLEKEKHPLEEGIHSGVEDVSIAASHEASKEINDLVRCL